MRQLYWPSPDMYAGRSAALMPHALRSAYWVLVASTATSRLSVTAGPAVHNGISARHHLPNVVAISRAPTIGRRLTYVPGGHRYSCRMPRSDR